MRKTLDTTTMQSSVLLFQPPERHLLLSLHSFSLQTAEFIKHGTRQQMKKSGGPLWGFSQPVRSAALIMFTPPFFGFPDFLTPGVKLQSVSAFSKKTLAYESSMFMIISSAECRKSQKTRAFWRFEICRRLNIEPPSLPRHV